jgi:hypothetical protein
MKEYATNFTFNSSGSFSGQQNYKIFYEQDGTLRGLSKKPYGDYNFLIDVNIQKLFYIVVLHVGFGDIIDFFTKKLYIKNLVMYITKGNCGCEARRKKFNKFLQIPYWIQIKSRPSHVDDRDNINEIKLARKNKKPIPKLKTAHDSVKELLEPHKEQFEKFFDNQKKEFLKMSTEHRSKVKGVDQKTNTDKIKPVDPKTIKGGCGCGKR